MLNLSFNPFPEIAIERLSLRQLSLSDAEAFYELRSNEQVMRYMDVIKMTHQNMAVDKINEMILEMDQHKGIVWALTLKSHSKLIGYVSIWRISAEHCRGEIAYALHPDFWNQGIISEALAAMLQYAFNQIQFHSLEANINPMNQQSEKVLLKQGFVQEAYFRENYFFNGQFLDSAIFSLLKRNHTV